MRYTLDPQDDQQGINDTSNFVHRIDPVREECRCDHFLSPAPLRRCSF